MRVLWAFLAVGLFLPLASASNGGPSVSITPTAPGPGCGDCVGVTAVVANNPPAGCADCDSLAAIVAAGVADGQASAHAGAIRGGFITISLFEADATAGRHGAGAGACALRGTCIEA